MFAEIVYPPDQEGQKIRRYQYETQAESYWVALDEIFRQFNHVNGDEEISIKGYKERSLSVGDVVWFPGQTSSWFICDNVGWKEVSKEFVRRYIEISTFSDRLMGLDFCVKRHPSLGPLLQAKED